MRTDVLTRNARSTARRTVAAPLLASLLLGVTLTLGGCGATERDDVPARIGLPQIATTTAPLTWITRRLAETHAEVICPLPKGVDPATWVPTPEAVQVLQRADLVVANGASYEAWLRTVSLPRRRVVRTASRLSGGLIASEDKAFVHSHGDGKAHRHGGVDGYTWMDPKALSEQASFVREALIGLLPAKADEIRTRFRALRTELAQAQARLEALAPAADAMRVFAAQPGYAYLARRIGWQLVTLDLRPSVRPTEAALEALRARHDVESEHHVLLWPEAPSAEVAAVLEERLRLVSLHLPLGLHAEASDFGAVLQSNLEHLERELGDP